MLRQAAFVNPAPMLKGALHCHTTRSDGKVSPEEVIRKHAENGYAFLAITDHRLYNYANFAPGTDILIVPGMEDNRSLCGNQGGFPCFHTVCIGPSREDGNGYGQDQRFENGQPVANQFEFQCVLDEHHANGNMTIYCHPEWSRTPARLFERLTGNFAMEIWNSGCAAIEHDTNAAYWDELLVQNIKIFGVATDDGHKPEQHCVGWVMVNAAPELNAILAALKAGAFYSSCGPEIHDFYIDNGVAVVECSPCASIAFHYGYRPNRIIQGGDGLICRAEMEVPEYFKYLRVSVKDEAGRRAWSNPIFIQ